MTGVVSRGEVDVVEKVWGNVWEGLLCFWGEVCFEGGWGFLSM